MRPQLHEARLTDQWRARAFFLLAVLSLTFPFRADAQAQRIPAPEEVIGFTIGTDYRLASYQDALKYFRALEQASPMIKLMEIGQTSMGKPMICVIITSAENMQRLDELRQISRQLALADVSTDEEARQLAMKGKAVVYIDGGLHSSEVAPAQHNLQLAYDLLTGKDAETRFIRDNVILLLNIANPDGMDMIVEWYRRNVGTPYEISPMPWLYHRYAGHDNNRDSYMLNLKETQAIHNLEFRVWYPQFWINHHQTSPFPSRISIPPLPEPLNPNVHPLVTRWKNLLGATTAAAFDRNGQPGAIARIVIDGWAPEMIDSVGDLMHTVSTSPETALYKYATPHEYTIDDFPEQYRDLMPSVFYPNPWRGGWWRLKDAVDYLLTFSKETLHTAALYREQLLYDRYRMGKDVIQQFQREPPYAWIIPKEQWDPPVAALLLQRVTMMGIQVTEAKSRFTVGGTTYPAGTWVIPMQQPFAKYVKSIFEEQRYPDLGLHPDAWQGVVRPQKFPATYLPPYDTAGWTLPYQMGVKAIPADKPLQVSLTAIETVTAPAGAVRGAAQSAYLLSARNNNSFIAVNRLLKSGVKVWRTTKGLTVNTQRFAPGSWMVPSNVVSKASMESLARELAVNIEGIRSELPADAFEVKAPRVGLYKSWHATADEGWTRWLLEQYEFTFTAVHDGDIKAGDLNKRFDVLIIPDQSTDDIVNGHKEGEVPPKYAGGMSRDGVAQVRRFVQNGGTLVLLNGSSLFGIEELGLPVRNALKGLKTGDEDEDASFADDGEASPIAPPEFACPASILKMKFNPHHPVAYGMPEGGATIFDNDSTAFEVPPEAEKSVAVIATYPEGELLLSGYLKGGNYLNGKVSAAEARLGKGTVILLGFPVQRRAQPHGTFKLLFNSLYYPSWRGSSSAVSTSNGAELKSIVANGGVDSK